MNLGQQEKCRDYNPGNLSDSQFKFRSVFGTELFSIFVFVFVLVFSSYSPLPFPLHWHLVAQYETSFVLLVIKGSTGHCEDKSIVRKLGKLSQFTRERDIVVVILSASAAL